MKGWMDRSPRWWQRFRYAFTVSNDGCRVMDGSEERAILIFRGSASARSTHSLITSYRAIAFGKFTD